jgi:REP element-mobilizing transposase RayT
MSAAAYYLTWNTYGTWLPGDARGSITHGANRYRDPRFPANDGIEAHVRRSLTHDPVLLTAEMRRVATEAISEHCRFRRWALHAVNVRTNHVHVVVSANEVPETVMAQLKARCTRVLRERRLIGAELKPWAKHGSTRYIWENQSITPAVRYVLEGQ